jgi:hypothetical protein
MVLAYHSRLLLQIDVVQDDLDVPSIGGVDLLDTRSVWTNARPWVRHNNVT